MSLINDLTISKKIPFEFLKSTAKLGSDLMLTQASGGNTSIKEGNSIFIKASGKSMSMALADDIFLEFDITNSKANDESLIGKALLVDPKKHLRPSIETDLHLVLPHKVIFHLHPVEILTWCIRTNARAELKSILEDINWRWVSYVKPGIKLAEVIEEFVKSGLPDVIFLANHGLVLGAPTVSKAEKLLFTLIERLQSKPSYFLSAPEVNKISALGTALGWRLPEFETVHALATNQHMFERAIKGALYPDHVVFLGCDIPYVCDSDISDAPSLLRKIPENAGYVLVKGLGVLVRNGTSKSVDQMLFCWSEVLRRVSQTEEINYLSLDETKAIINWDAEIYRKSVV
jgi:rhamnose utilization protein RhaD (predicted bifunctional aldolase and dehydrogenase)